MPNVTQQTAGPSPFGATADPAEQAALEDALEAAGLPPPGSMYNNTQASLAGYCSNGVYIPPKKRSIYAQVNAPQSRAPRSNILKRDDDVRCRDLVGLRLGYCLR
jgi:hypothetical protein